MSVLAWEAIRKAATEHWDRRKESECGCWTCEVDGCDVTYCDEYNALTRSVGESHDRLVASARTLEVAALPNIGALYLWEPTSPSARILTRVTDVKWNGEEWMVEGETPKGRFWNDLMRWIEATVLVEPADSKEAKP